MKGEVREGQFNRLANGQHPETYGYAVTSHSSQGVTADRVLVHVDTEQAHEQLINSRLAYVSVSRGRYDAQIYTNDARSLSGELSRETSKRSALEAERSSGPGGDAHAQQESRTEEEVAQTPPRSAAGAARDSELL